MEAKDDRRGNRVTNGPRAKWPGQLSVRKIPAEDAGPYGTAISTHGDYVYGAYDGDRLVCIAATADEARRKYRAAMRREEGDRLESRKMLKSKGL